MPKPTIGFIGLGLMGSAMVANLQDRGYPMVLMANRSRTAVEQAVARGAREVTTSKEVAQNSDVIMLCVDTSESVEGRMRGDDGIIAGLSTGKIVIDFGTSLPESTQNLGAEVRETGADLIDAPIGRTPDHARNGQINLMVGGRKDTIAQIETLLNDIADNVFHLGALSAGHTSKLINNFFSMTTANAMAEAFVMADCAGVDRQSIYNVMSAGPGHSPIMDFIRSYAVDNDPTPMAFAIKNGAKDLGYYQRMAEEVTNGSALIKAPLNAMRAAIDSGQGDDLIPQLVDYYSQNLKK